MINPIDLFTDILIYYLLHGGLKKTQKKIDWFYNIDNKNNKTSQQRKIKDMA